MVKKTACSCTVHKNNTVIGIFNLDQLKFYWVVERESNQIGNLGWEKKDVEDISVNIGGDIMLKGQIVSTARYL